MSFLRRRNRRFADAGGDYSTEVAGSNYERHYGLPNVFIGGNWAHGVARGNNYVLSKQPDWHDLLNRKDDYQQLASFVHDYQLATAKNWYGVRWAHRNYAQNMSHKVHPMGPAFFQELSQPGRSKWAGFVPHNLNPSYGIPDTVWQVLGIGDEGRQSDHFNHHYPTEQSFGTAGAEDVFGDNESPINLHIDHKNMNRMKGSLSGDTKKQATTNVQVGSGSSLQSVPAILGAFYKGSRTLSNSWHHSGTSKMNERSVFTYVFRHTRKQPWHTATQDSEHSVLSPSVANESPSDYGQDLESYMNYTPTETPVPRVMSPAAWDGNMQTPLVRATIGGDDNLLRTVDPNFKDLQKIKLMQAINNTLSQSERFQFVFAADGLPTGVYVSKDELSAADQSLAAITNQATFSITISGTSHSVKLPVVTSKDYRLPFYRFVVKSGVKVITPERPVYPFGGTHDVPIAGNTLTLKPSTWYSPYCLQELENISWNLNRMKLLPSQKGQYVKSSLGGLPGRLKRDSLVNADDFVDNISAGGIADEDKEDATSAFGTFKNYLYDAGDGVSHSPLFEMGKRYSKAALHNFTAMPGETENPNSVVLSTRDNYRSHIVGANDPFLAGVRNYNEFADFKAQLGKSSASFTFVNTGDTTMIVDAVVHRAKENMAVGKQSSGSAYGGLDLTADLVSPYLVNYGRHHRANQVRKVSNDVPIFTDPLLDPDTKFLPTSYRLSKNGPEQEAFDVSFIDTDRRRLVVKPNSRKTIRFIMPTKSYEPINSVYEGIINDHGMAITFGVTGKTTKVVADTEGDKLAAQAVGRTAAATSFHIIGYETQQIYPCAISEYEQQTRQIHTLPDPELATGQGDTKKLHSAVYIGPNIRDIKSRYANLLIDDGSMPKGQINSSSLKRGIEEVAATVETDGSTKNLRVGNTSSSSSSGTVDFPDTMNVEITGISDGLDIPVSGSLNIAGTNNSLPVNIINTEVPVNEVNDAPVPNLLAINTDSNYASFVGTLNVILSEYAVSVGQVPSSIPVSGLLTMSSAPSHWSSSTLGFIYSDGSLADSSYLLLNTHYNFVG